MQTSYPDWVSKTEGYLDTIKSGCSDIINYQNVPSAYAGIHANLVTLAGQVQSVMDQYKTGIDNKDFNTLSAANHVGPVGFHRHLRAAAQGAAGHHLHQ